MKCVLRYLFWIIQNYLQQLFIFISLDMNNESVCPQMCSNRIFANVSVYALQSYDLSRYAFIVAFYLLFGIHSTFNNID